MEEIEKIIQILKMPKIEIGISEKRSIAQYETKEYTARLWLPFNSLMPPDYEKIFDELQDAITKQEIKDGIKPTRKDESMIQQVFKEVDEHE